MAEEPMAQQREVQVALDDMKFHAAHFVAFKGFREPLHGHNYTVRVRVGTQGGDGLGADGYVVDFGELKHAARASCKALNQKTLVPTKSDVLQVRESVNMPGHIELKCEDGAFIVLPAKDCALIPVMHSTAEELAEYLWQRFMQDSSLGRLLLSRRVRWLEVMVSERPGQSAVFRKAVSSSSRSPSPPRRPSPRPCCPSETASMTTCSCSVGSGAHLHMSRTAEPAQKASLTPVEEAEAAFRKVLDSLGPKESGRSELDRTPYRAAKAFHEMTSGLHVDPRSVVGKGVFEVEPSSESDCNDVVSVREIPFNSLCEHHLLPFSGVAHVAYIPAGRVLGLSKFARLLAVFARRPQLQERLSQQFADCLIEILSPKAVLVTIEAHHTCMSARGVESPANTKTLVFRGPLKDEPAVREALLQGVGSSSRTERRSRM